MPAFELPDGRQVAITAHLVDRWRESTCPCASPLEALTRLDRWLDLAGTVVDVPPAWADSHVPPAAVLAGWIVAGDYAIPVLRLPSGRCFAPTLIARGGLTTTERLTRNLNARTERRRRAGRRRNREAQEARSGARARRRTLRAPAFDDQATG